MILLIKDFLWLDAEGSACLVYLRTGLQLSRYLDQILFLFLVDANVDVDVDVDFGVDFVWLMFAVDMPGSFRFGGGFSFLCMGSLLSHACSGRLVTSWGDRAFYYSCAPTIFA